MWFVVKFLPFLFVIYRNITTFVKSSDIENETL